MRLINIQRTGWAIAGYGLLVFLLLPRGISVMSDDFGYLGSVIETLRHNRPWTDDWLEPWSASLSVFAAILYKITGNFQVATQGLQAACAGAACAGAYALCRTRELGPKASLLISAFGLTFPALLWKSIEFTALVVYVPCLLWAIWAASKSRWGLFFVLWAIAFASRQSAITWLALPLWEVARAWLSYSKTENIALSRPALVLWGAALTFVVFSVGMNHTQSQKMITQHLFEHVQIVRAERNFSIGMAICAVSMGVGALILGWGTARTPIARNIPLRLMMALLIAVGLISITESIPRMFAEHPNFEGRGGQLYANLLIAAGIAGLLIIRFSIRWELLTASVAAGLLVSLRYDVWDYYYFDVAAFALFSVVPPCQVERTEALWSPTRVLSGALALIFAAFHLWFVFEQKCRVDRDYAVCVLTERAIREQKIALTDIGFAPYGFIGWRLHRHFVEHEGKNDPDIGGFMRYQRSGAAELILSPMRIWPDSKSLRPLSGDASDRIVQGDVFRVGWLWNQRLTILRSPSTAEVKPSRLAFDHTKYLARLFPLSNAEWREFIEAAAR